MSLKDFQFLGKLGRFHNIKDKEHIQVCIEPAD